MRAPTTLCLNMIVKNEMANLERCLAAAAPHIDCWVIADTGSSDGTQDFIRGFFAERGIPGELHSHPFENFEQARNAALDCAYASPLAFDYLLLTDADMELVVEDPDFRGKLEAPCYQLLQRAGISYWNARIARRDVGAHYRGVTHEYLDGAGTGLRLEGVWFRDYASGSNRVDKFERDVRLLEKALESDPDSPRYWFYLAQSLKDAGRYPEAAEAYAKRITLGGWVEEAWHARLSRARCLREMGDEGGFVSEALAAFDARPQRAEPLYDLAKFHREKGLNEAAVLFAERGLSIPWPEQDGLFVESFVYETGLREEYAIAGYYCADAERKAKGAAFCDALALDRDIPEDKRELARRNLRFYAAPVTDVAPSFSARQIKFTPPEGWRPLNPSIARDGERMMLIARTVNYVINKDGGYDMPPDDVIRTRNFLLELDDSLAVESAEEIQLPADLPAPKYPLVRGFEDMRLFSWGGALWVSSTVRELTEEGWCQQVLARLGRDADGARRLTDWSAMRRPGPQRNEKNWTPMISDDALRFVYLCDPTTIIDQSGAALAVSTPKIAADGFRGSSQAVAFDGGWLMVVHEAPGGEGRRRYHHRFVSLDAAGELRGVSRAFYFNAPGIEFAAGMAWARDGTTLHVSYGVEDQQAWIGSFRSDEVRAALRPVASLS